MANEWIIWQLVDSAFPAGGFAHSGGLESAWQQGCIHDVPLLDVFQAGLLQAWHGPLPMACAVHDDPNRFGEVDRLCDAFLVNPAANRASRSQGQALLASAERIFRAPALERLKTQRKAEHWPGHLAPVFGAMTASLGVGRADSARLFLFHAVRGMVSSAVRLGIVGPMEGQSLQSQLASSAESLVARSAPLSLQDVCQSWPVLEICQGGHDRLYSRLFHS